MVDIQTVSIAVASASVTFAAIYYLWQIRHQTKIRQTDVVMRLYDKFGSTEFQKAYQMMMGLEYEDYADYRKRYGTNAEVKAAGITVNTFFEGIGLILIRISALLLAIAFFQIRPQQTQPTTSAAAPT